MDERKELFSEKVAAGTRTYFFDVKETTDGTKYLSISETRLQQDDTRTRGRIMVFEENIIAFRDALVRAANRAIGQDDGTAASARQGHAEPAD